MFRIARIIKSIKLTTGCNNLCSNSFQKRALSNITIPGITIIRQNRNKSLLTKSTTRIYGYLSKRFIPSSASPTTLKSNDDLPGDFDINEEETIRLFADPVNLFNEKYEIAKTYDPVSPMIKMNVLGFPSIILFSHDLVKKWQEYELRGQTQRCFYPIIGQLFGKNTEDMYGRVHGEWKKKAIKSFKPDIMNQYTPFIQKAANEIVLSGIADISQNNDNESVYFCKVAKEFTFEIGAKFVMGPLLNDKERKDAFKIFQVFAKGLTAEAIFSDPSDPNSIISKAFIAKDQINDLLGKKLVFAQKLIENNEWENEYGDEMCLLRGLIENDAIFDNNGEYGIYDKTDVIIGALFAAYDSSATSLTNLVYALYKHPEQAQVLRNAIMNHPELSNPETVLSMEILNGCNELECFVQESQRVYGIFRFIVRRIHDENGLDFGGYLLPKGTGIGIPIKWLHFGEGSWTESDEFKPSRFDKSSGRSKQDRGDIGRYNNIPFATGLHKCLGIHLALLEMKIYTVLLLRDWEFELDESKLNDDGIINGMNLSDSLAHYNVHLKMKRREN